MNSKDWLFEQLQQTHNNSSVSKEGDFINIVDTPYKGIIIKHNDGLHVSFKNFDLIEFSSLAVYLEPRLKRDDIRVYSKQSDKSIWVYFDKKFSEGSKGEFEKGMWVYKIIDKLVKDISTVVERVIN